MHLHTDWCHNVVPHDIISYERRSQHMRPSLTDTCCRALDPSHQGYLGIKLFILCLSSPDLPTLFYISKHQTFSPPAEASGGVSLYPEDTFEHTADYNNGSNEKQKCFFFLDKSLDSSKCVEFIRMVTCGSE